ncbi:hypothetical protein PEP31012_02467 [Pandoraea eparura]|uniref:Uncharacterized protein n=1 Tax=Pandoraea eparura TaxID=2508291 RepID=A0A5E4V9L4_9BURK|nr:hypothetical protein [Pandoraea eparura]VVE07755.1 hypothetical protein PEP31012_02467 [Pandoraea eparura]
MQDVKKKKLTFYDWCLAAFFWGGPISLSAVISLLVPNDILTRDLARQWVEFVLQVAPKMLDVPVESEIPQVVKFYHATMLSSILIWAPALIFVSLNKLKGDCFDGRLIGRYKLWIIYEIFLGLLTFLISWCFFGFGYRYGKMASLWYSRESLFFSGFIPYMMLFVAFGVGFSKLVELFLFSKGVPWFRHDSTK